MSNTNTQTMGDAPMRGENSRCDIVKPLIAHVIYRLGVGGLENGVVNLVNRLPEERFRHAIVCLTDFTDFRSRITRADVEVHAIHKAEGHDLSAIFKLYRLFRKLRPAVVHTRNMGCMEALVPAWLARVPVRIHGEHGWDVYDPNGEVRKYQTLRWLHAPLVDQFVPLSQELETYLIDRVGISPHKITRIYNGVDVDRFTPGAGAGLPEGFAGPNTLVIGTVGRMHGVKDQVNLAQAFIQLSHDLSEYAERLRLVMIGDGPLRDVCESQLNQAGLGDRFWLPGSRDDVPQLMRSFDIFVLPSTAEGISNTVLEAMACALPVVATAVGGNRELIEAGVSGELVPASNSAALATALARYVLDAQLRSEHAVAARKRVESQFSLTAMMARYTELYDRALDAKAPGAVASAVGKS